MQIREFTTADWQELWPIMREVIQAQETFAYAPHMTPEQGGVFCLLCAT